MPELFAYETAIELLEAAHTLAGLLFADYARLEAGGAPPETKKRLADRICSEIAVHAQVEEEIFYPAVHAATGDDALLDHAKEGHGKARGLVARIAAMTPGDAQLDDCVGQLREIIAHHVAGQREKVFLQARHAMPDLRAMVPRLAARKIELKAAAAAGRR